MKCCKQQGLKLEGPSPKPGDKQQCAPSGSTHSITPPLPGQELCPSHVGRKLCTWVFCLFVVLNPGHMLGKYSATGRHPQPFWLQMAPHLHTLASRSGQHPMAESFLFTNMTDGCDGGRGLNAGVGIESPPKSAPRERVITAANVPGILALPNIPLGLIALFFSLIQQFQKPPAQHICFLSG